MRTFSLSSRFAGGLLILGLATSGANSSYAQQYAIPWFKIAGGGGMQSTGGVYTLSGTIGQPDAGRVAGGSYRSEGGFWGIAIQQLGYPVLNITRAGTNALVTWVTAETGFIVQTNADLTTPNVWSDTAFTPALTGTTNTVTVPLNPAVKTFFRLRRP